eukprot:scaffold74197_cov63-Phaeocystis_antarctica.AAC.3
MRRCEKRSSHPGVAVKLPSSRTAAPLYVPSCHQSPPQLVLCTCVGSTAPAAAAAAAAYAASKPGVAAGRGWCQSRTTCPTVGRRRRRCRTPGWARLAPVGEELVVGVVGGHRLRQQRAGLAARPVFLVAQSGVYVDHARALATRPRTIDHHGRARVNGLVVVGRRPGRPHGGVEPIPDGHRERRPVHEVLGDEVAVVRPAARRSGQVDLVKVVDDAVHRVEHGAVGVVLPAAVLVHQTSLPGPHGPLRQVVVESIPTGSSPEKARQLARDSRSLMAENMEDMGRAAAATPTALLQIEPSLGFGGKHELPWHFGENTGIAGKRIRKYAPNRTPLHGSCLTAAPVCALAELGFQCRSRLQRRRPIEVHSRLRELCCRARPQLPSAKPPAQHRSPHLRGCQIVRRRPRNPRRQRLEPLLAPPLRLGHLGARFLCQHVEGHCRGLCPVPRAHQHALPGLEEPLRSLHGVLRVGEHSTEVVVRLGLVGPQGDGLAEGPCCSACVLLRLVPRALSQ